MPRNALRQSHIGIVLNDRSAPMEERLHQAIAVAQERIQKEFGLTLVCSPRLLTSEIVERLRARYGPEGLAFQREFKGVETYLKPDGGFWYVKEWGTQHCVLVAEAKRQGTNQDRLKEGKAKQAKGNAIERLGKNMRGVDAYFAGEAITPFICFGEGCDFAPDSSILDRVATMNGFFPLNAVFVNKHRAKDGELLRPVSLFFREEAWTPKEMAGPVYEVLRTAIQHYKGAYPV